MKKEELLVCIEHMNLDFSTQLREFFSDFFSKVENLYKNVIPDERYTVNELCSWLELEGYANIQDTIKHLDENDKEKVIGFIEYYGFMFNIAQGDYEKLIDLLFGIPDQFVRDFYDLDEQENNNLCMNINYPLELTYNYISLQGTLNKVSCFV